MQYRQLGKNGPEIPVIGFGSWPISGGMGHLDQDDAVNLVRAAIDEGITLIDTAQGYNRSEGVVGRALQDGYRDRCFLASKVSGDFSREGIGRAIDNSLKVMKVDYVDLFQIHYWNPKFPIDESMEALADLQKAGKIRYIGVSNFTADKMQQALETATFQSTQPRYNMFNRTIEAEDVPFCREHGIGILAHSPLAKGILSGRYKKGHKFPEDDERAAYHWCKGDTFDRILAIVESLTVVARDKGLTPIQLAIAWLLRLPEVTCVLVGAKTPEQIKEQTGAVGVTFTDDELAHIETILKDAGDRYVVPPPSGEVKKSQP